MVVIVQIIIGREIEIVAGWLRVTIIYVFSSTAGLAVSIHMLNRPNYNQCLILQKYVHVHYLPFPCFLRNMH